jgi:hypothetical protein
MTLTGFHSKLFPVLSTTTRFTGATTSGIARASSGFLGKLFSFTFLFLSSVYPHSTF